MFAYTIGDNGPSRWHPTTLREQGFDEAYLELLIANDPSTLGLDPYSTGLGTRVVAIRQTRLESPTARTLRPDIVLLSAMGHIVIVEVKLGDNPELRDRRVISQIIDYASGLSNLDDRALIEWLGQDGDSRWTDVVARLLPEVTEVDRLAAVLRDRIRRAEIHLVIACDQVPAGLRETARQISAQSALGDFVLHVAELRPYVNDSQPGLLIIPQEVTRTEIVARTAITLVKGDDDRVSVEVTASSPAEVQDAMEQLTKDVRPEFQAVVDAYDAQASDGMRSQGRAARYRQIVPSTWPGRIHFELLDGRGGPDYVGLELHVESPDYPQLCSYVEQLGPRLQSELGEPEYSQKWFKGCRLAFRAPIDQPLLAAQRMQALIDQSMSEIDRLLGQQ